MGVIITNLDTSDVRRGFLSLIKNRKLVDKNGLAYFIGMVDHWRGLYAVHRKREELFLELSELVLDDKNLYRCIQSDWTRTQIINQLNKLNP